MGKRLVIIGAGVAGLSAGIYARLNGFETEIYEKHSIPGGECTGWKRQEYYFDGCIHWLLGSQPGSELNTIWREVGALGDDVEIVNHKYLYCHEEDGQTVWLYTEPSKLEQHLLELSPSDSKLIRYLCKAIKGMRSMIMPVSKPMDQMNWLDNMRMLIGIAPAMRYLPYCEKTTLDQFAMQFKSPVLRNALTQLIPGYHALTSLVTTMASLSRGDSGWPMGGSLQFAKRMEQRYLSLGGRINYHAPVTRVRVENGVAKGVQLADGQEIDADYVISTADGHWTLFDLLQGEHLDDQLSSLYTDQEAYPIYATVQVSLGIDCDLSHYPHTLAVRPEHPIDAGGVVNAHIGIRHYCYDPNLMPLGKSTVTSVIKADYDWWKALRQNPEVYRQQKERVAREVMAVVEQRYPETRGKIQVHDVATPVTYERYCNAWRGTWMAWATTPKGKVRYLPGMLPGLAGFFQAGQWTMPPGGLPTAVVTGRWVIQRICGLEHQDFLHSLN